jgi:hypothetical protein
MVSRRHRSVTSEDRKGIKTAIVSRFYLLSKSAGAMEVEALFVEEAHPFVVCFVSQMGSQQFEKTDLVWWCDATERVPGPFENFESRSSARDTRGRNSAMGWGMIDEIQRGAMTNADRSRRSAAAFGALMKALLPAIPQGWKEAVLELKVSYDLLAGHYRIAHRLRNPATDAEAMDFSENLFLAIEVFHRIEIDGGENWNACVLRLQLRPDGYEVQVERRRGMNFARR